MHALGQPTENTKCEEGKKGQVSQYGALVGTKNTEAEYEVCLNSMSQFLT